MKKKNVLTFLGCIIFTNSYSLASLTAILCASLMVVLNVLAYVALGEVCSNRNFCGVQTRNCKWRERVIFEQVAEIEGTTFVDESRDESDDMVLEIVANLSATSALSLADSMSTVLPLDEENVIPQDAYKSDNDILTIHPSDDTEYDLLMRLVQAEAGNTEDLVGCRLVTDVVLNRVDDPRFPNSITEVIFQKNKSTAQFATTLLAGFDSVEPNDKVRQAVMMELEGGRLDALSLYFARKPLTSEGLYQHGAHYFSH